MEGYSKFITTQLTYDFIRKYNFENCFTLPCGKFISIEVGPQLVRKIRGEKLAKLALFLEICCGQKSYLRVLSKKFRIKITLRQSRFVEFLYRFFFFVVPLFSRRCREKRYLLRLYHQKTYSWKFLQGFALFFGVSPVLKFFNVFVLRVFLSSNSFSIKSLISAYNYN